MFVFPVKTLKTTGSLEASDPQGFDWGAGALGNSVWTGLRLCDLLAHLGITRPSREHRCSGFFGFLERCLADVLLLFVVFF